MAARGILGAPSALSKDVLAGGPRFFQFSAMLSTKPIVSVEIESWEDITNATEINAHCPGIGKSFGWLAVDVFHEIIGEANSAIQPSAGAHT